MRSAIGEPMVDPGPSGPCGAGPGVDLMAFDEGLAHRLREQFSSRGDVTEKKMFGGLCFMVSGHMCCGIVGETLMARVGPDRYADCLARPYAREMDFTGKPMKGMVYVDADGFEADDELAAWVETCLAFVGSLPPKVLR
jgi:TfoX/Sxy family transcriptional regulator of competence genes